MRRVVVVPLLAAGTLFLGGGGCDSGPSLADRTTPQEIRGLWSADQESYAGRNLEIFENGLVFHTGDGDLDFTVHMIRSLASQPAGEGTGTAFEIEYLVEETVFTFSFTYKPEEDAIFFKNQPQLRWTRVESEG
jgi:hypothetical protein